MNPGLPGIGQRLPSLSWRAMLAGALVLLLLSVACMETLLALHGYKPTLAEYFPLWERQRERADTLGADALILVGNSRMQNDVDLDTLRRASGLAPVQLAVSGSSFLSELRNLAADPKITGTILVNFEAEDLVQPEKKDLAYSYQQEYDRIPHGSLPDFSSSEGWLSDQFHAHLRSYADGVRPLTSLLLRILPGERAGQYTRIRPDREVTVDFAMLPFPRYALVRAAHEYGPGFPDTRSMSDAEFRMALEAKIAALTPAADTVFKDNIRAVSSMTAAIEARGGHVFFVVFPRSGYIRQIQDRRYPRETFWDRFVAYSSAQTLNFEDVPALRTFNCPDGAHLDPSDRAMFTVALVSALRLKP